MGEVSSVSGARWGRSRRPWGLVVTTLGVLLGGGLLSVAAPVAGALVPVATTTGPLTCQGDPATSGAMLATAIARASGTTTISLAANCTYSVGEACHSGSVGPDAFAPVVPGESLTIEGNGSTIEVSGGAAMRLFQVDAGGSLTMSDLTLTGGHDASIHGGGAIWSAGSLVVTGTAFLDDTASGNGGAIASTGTLTVSGSAFRYDTAGYDGGAIASGDGGGPATATVASSVFSHDAAGVSGSAADGGAIDSGDHGGTGTLEVSESTFSSDVVGSSTAMAFTAGGAIASGVNGTGELTATASAFTGDQALAAAIPAVPEEAQPLAIGGAIAAGGKDGGGGALAVTVSTFQGNAATYGAAVAEAVPGSIVASTLAGNVATATSRAFGMSPSTLLLGSRTTLAANLIADAPAGGGACDLAGGHLVDGGYNLVSDRSCGLTAGTSKVVAALSSFLDPLALNGGPTATMRPKRSGSDPAVGVIPSGTPSPPGAPGYPNLCGRTDQTGYTSPAFAPCAVGAYEPRSTPSPSVPSLAPAFTGPVVNPAGVPVPLLTPSLTVEGPVVQVPYGSPLPELLPTCSG